MVPLGTIFRWVMTVAIATGFFICPCAHGEQSQSNVTDLHTEAAHSCCAKAAEDSAPLPAKTDHEKSCPHCGQQLVTTVNAELTKHQLDAAPLLAISELLFAPLVPQSMSGDEVVLAAPPNPPQQSVLCVFLI
jgi:hypothetical protein